MALIRNATQFSRTATRSLNHLFESPVGQRLRVAERDALAFEFRRLFSPLIVQVGGPDPWIEASPAAHKIWVVADPVNDVQVPQVSGWPAQLPLAGNTADALVLAHALDTTRHPQAVLREAVRVMRPGGTLLVVGFDPTGWIGLTRALGLRGPRALWLRKQRLVDWLTLLDCRVERLSTLGHSSRLSALTHWNLPGGSFYLMRVKKERIVPPSALRQRLRGRLLSLGGARGQVQLGRSVTGHSVSRRSIGALKGRDP